MDSNAGRPGLTNSQLDILVRKLEPFLKRGLGVRKACYLANIPHSTVYDYLNKDQEFSDRIEATKSYRANLVTDILSYRLEKVFRKVQNLRRIETALRSHGLNPKTKALVLIQANENEITKDEWKFIQWIATVDKGVNENYSSVHEKSETEKESISSVLDKLEVSRTDYKNMSFKASEELERLTSLDHY